MKHLSDVCDDRETGPNNFVAEFPGASKNQDPSNINMKNLFVPTSDHTSGRWYWACNVHAFCYECVDETNTVDDYCKATVIRTKSMYAPSGVFKDPDTYCGYDVDHLWQCAWSSELA